MAFRSAYAHGTARRDVLDARVASARASLCRPLIFQNASFITCQYHFVCEPDNEACARELCNVQPSIAQVTGFPAPASASPGGPIRLPAHGRLRRM